MPDKIEDDLNWCGQVLPLGQEPAKVAGPPVRDDFAPESLCADPVVWAIYYRSQAALLREEEGKKN